MILESLDFVEYPGQPGEWSIERFDLGRISLVVGRNATGKTRLLNVINSLGRLLSGEAKETAFSAKWHVIFRDGANTWEYHLEHDVAEIQQEDLIYNGVNVLQRGAGGLGRIQAEEVDGADGAAVRIRFRAPQRQVGVVAKRDSIQHPFLEPLNDWGHAVRHFNSVMR